MADTTAETISKAWDEVNGDKTTGADTTTTGVNQQATVEEIDAPADWKHEDREAFRAWQPDVRKAFLDRYTNFTKSAEEKYADQVKAAQEYAPLRDIISSRQQVLQQRGVQPQQWLSNLAQLDDFATRDPKGFARWYFQNTGLNPSEIFGQGQQPQGQMQQDQFADPQLLAMQQEIQRLTGLVNQQANGFQTFQQQLQQAQVSRREQEIEQFRTAKGQDGKSLHPYFDEVQDVVISLLRAGVASDLPNAYEQAVYAHAPTRAKVLADQQAQQRREAEKQQREHADKAKKAAVSVSSNATSKGNGQDKPKKGENVMATLKRAAADIEARRH